MAIFVSALIIGGFLGTIYGLMAFGMVAAYRISRVVNLGQAGIAAMGATVFYWMSSVWGAPVIVSMAAAVLVGAVIGAGLGYCNVLMAEWPKGFVMIFTLCVTLVLYHFVNADMLPTQTVHPVSPFGDGGFDFALTFVAAHQIGTFAVTLGIVVASTVVLRRTRSGLYVRAIYDDPASAATIGIPLRTYVIAVWAVGGALASVAGILISNRLDLDTTLLLFVTIWALAGSVLGGMESFVLAFAGGLLLGVAEGIIGGMFSASLPPGTENLGVVVIMAAAVLYAGFRRRELVDVVQA